MIPQTETDKLNKKETSLAGEEQREANLVLMSPLLISFELEGNVIPQNDKLDESNNLHPTVFQPNLFQTFVSIFIIWRGETRNKFGS